MRILPAVLILCWPLMAGAQGLSRAPPVIGGPAVLDCTNALTQIEMTACTERAYQEADRALNAAYRRAMAMARRLEVANGGAASDILRDAQRAWIPFRDKACAAEAQAALGGSIMGQLTLECLTRLTRVRTGDLQRFADGY